MIVSIITVCYNSEDTIEETILSVSRQNYNLIEYIIIDGGSSDSTIRIINNYKNHIDFFVSENDFGLYDAMNKGIDNATGDIIGILNSDDLYSSDNVITKVVEAFEKNNFNALYGDLVYVDRKNTNHIKRYWRSSSSNVTSFIQGWHPPHPTLFIKKSVYESYGFFDLNYPLASDFELMFRFFHIFRVSHFYLPETLVKMRLGGQTNKSFINILKQNFEILNVFKKYNIKVFPLFYIYKRLLPKFLDLIFVKLFS